VIETIEQLIDDFHERPLPATVRRDVLAPVVSGKATAVVGMRRAGKTWFCYQRMEGLLKTEVPKERLLYLNFEDERLLPFRAKDFASVLEAYYRKFPRLKNERCYLFLDEVQGIEGWDKFVRRVLDTEDLEVWVTGSSSKLLSAEIATSLRGRSLTTEIFPFSFREFLRFHEVDAGSTNRFGARARAELQSMVGRYLAEGGFPEVQGLDRELSRQVLQSYVDVVVLRDVIERHSVSNAPALRAMIRHVMGAPASRFSVNKFYNSLRSQGVSCTKNDLYEYLDYLKDAFLLYAVPIHSDSEAVRRVNPQKLYAVDTGMLSAMSFRAHLDRGVLLENLAYMHLRRREARIDYLVTSGGSEVDFLVTPSRREARELIQVSWTLEQPDTRAREIGALSEAMKELRVARGTVVTWLEEGREGRIHIVPAWKWLLG
jgi:predicted AAA+ superfamily ATPase